MITDKDYKNNVDYVNRVLELKNFYYEKLKEFNKLKEIKAEEFKKLKINVLNEHINFLNNFINWINHAINWTTENQPKNLSINQVLYYDQFYKLLNKTLPTVKTMHKRLLKYQGVK